MPTLNELLQKAPTNSSAPTNSLSPLAVALETTIPPLMVDTTPASKNPTNYPEDMHETLTHAITMLKQNMDNPTLVSTSINHVMMTLQNNPELVNQLRPEDGQLFVRALQNSYSVVKRSKAKGVAKRTQKREDIDSMKQVLQGLNFGKKTT